ncbi:hypothetical protein [Corynebacterium urogenitale]
MHSPTHPASGMSGARGTVADAGKVDGGVWVHILFAEAEEGAIGAQ